MRFKRNETPRLSSRWHRLIHEGKVALFLSEANTVCVDPPTGVWLDKLREDYINLVGEFATGEVAPDRRERYAMLKTELHDLAEVLRYECPDAPTSKHNLKREVALALAYVEANERPLARILNDYFDLFHSSDYAPMESVEPLVAAVDKYPLSEKDVELLFSRFLLNEDIDAYDRAFVCGALSNNILSRHNEYVALAIIDTLKDERLDVAVVTRLGVTLVLDIVSNREQWEDNPVLYERLRRVCAESDVAKTALYYFVAGVFLSHITPEVARFVSDDLKQRLTAASLRIEEREDRSFASLVSEDIVELLGGEEARKSCNMLEEWKAAGVDISYGINKEQKHYSFFEPGINWYRPFNNHDPLLIRLYSGMSREIGSSLLNSLERTIVLPDSDRFSMAFGFVKLPEREVGYIAAEMVLDALGRGAIKCNDEEFHVSEDMFRCYAKRYVFDLYRAFMMRGDHFGYCNAFEVQECLLDTPVYDILVGFRDATKMLGTQLVESKDWPLACSVFSRCVEKEPTNADLLRKYSLCLLQCDRVADAMEYLKRAELVDDGDVWTKSKLAECSYKLGKYSGTLYYYGEVVKGRGLKMRERNIKGLALCKLGRYAEASDIYKELIAESDVYHSEALDCFVRNGEFDLVRDIVDERIEKSEGEKRDLYVLYSIVCGMVEKRFPQAIILTKEISNEKWRKEVARQINSLREVLRRYGVEEVDIEMMREEVTSTNNTWC